MKQNIEFKKDSFKQRRRSPNQKKRSGSSTMFTRNEKKGAQETSQGRSCRKMKHDAWEGRF